MSGADLMRFALNPFRDLSRSYGPRQIAAFAPDAAASARSEIVTWPGHERTPLLSMPSFAAHLGLERLWIKDEGSRKPLRSFKVLGAAYALGETLRDAIEVASGRRPSYASILSREHAKLCRRFKAVAATDGNHGRALAWGAHFFGAQCAIYLPQNVSAAREAAIASFGAEIFRTRENYDTTVRRAREDAEANGWSFLQDTSFAGYTETHRRIMHGYSVMTAELLEQLANERPTHMFLQVGCGGMAAAIIAHLWHAWGGAALPRIVLVQSMAADTLVRSFEAGRPVIVDGDHNTMMIGIACGEIGLLSWNLLGPAGDAAIAVDDAFAIEVMRRCAAGHGGDAPLVVGETGAAGLAGLVAVVREHSIARLLRLDVGARVLVFNSEGETDPERYADIVGYSAAAVRVAGEGNTNVGASGQCGAAT